MIIQNIYLLSRKNTLCVTVDESDVKNGILSIIIHDYRYWKMRTLQLKGRMQ